MNIRIEISPESRRMLDANPNLGDVALEAMRGAMDDQNQLTIGEITVKRLSFPKAGPTQPDGLRVDTTRLRGSIYASKTVTVGSQVISDIGSNVKYAAIHEFGGKTKAHVIQAKPGKRLAFTVGGKVVFATRVNHPGSQMPARRYVGRTLDERAEAYAQALGTAVDQALEKALP